MGSPVKAREWEKSLTIKCRLCGGARCKRCSESAALAKLDSPVRGLHADWVADCALAMMRPSSRIMGEYRIAEQFHKLNITAVFNLTLPGEHPYCGDGLGASGFPYDPEMDFMAENIRFYNFGWEDMTTPTLAFMMDIVKVIASVLLTGHDRVAVHCHAGYGRTGITIACALIFLHNIPPELAIRLVRRDRPGSVQTTGQTQFVHDFYAYLNAARIVFALPKVHDRFTLAETVEHQNRCLHGERIASSNLPRVLDFLCAEVERTSDVVAVASTYINHVCVRHQEAWPRTSERTKEFYHAIPSESSELRERHRQFIASAVDETCTHSDGVSFRGIEVPEVVTREQLFPIKVGFNAGEWNWADASALCANAPIHTILLLDWIEHLREPLLSSQLVDKLLNVPLVPPLVLPPSPKPVVYGKPAATTQNQLGSNNNGLGDAYQFQGLYQLPAYTMRSMDRILSCLRVLEAKLEQHDAGDVLFDAICVRTAMALFHLSAFSCSSASLRRHADCVELLIDKWHDPKRLELNLESLQRLGTHRNSSYRLTQSTSAISYSPESSDKVPSHDATSSKPNESTRSSIYSAISTTSLPARTSQESSSPTSNLPGTLRNDIVDPTKSSGDAQALPSTSSYTILPSPRPSSPNKADLLPLASNRREEESNAEGKMSVPSLLFTSLSSRKIDLSPLPTPPVSDKKFDLSDDNIAVTLSAELTNSTHMNIPALPNIRDGGRYGRKTGYSVK